MSLLRQRDSAQEGSGVVEYSVLLAVGSAGAVLLVGVLAHYAGRLVGLPNSGGIDLAGAFEVWGRTSGGSGIVVAGALTLVGGLLAALGAVLKRRDSRMASLLVPGVAAVAAGVCVGTRWVVAQWPELVTSTGATTAGVCAWIAIVAGFASGLSSGWAFVDRSLLEVVAVGAVSGLVMGVIGLSTAGFSSAGLDMAAVLSLSALLFAAASGSVLASALGGGLGTGG